MIQDVQCEREALSGLISSASCRDFARGQLTEDCFTDPLCIRVFQALYALDMQGTVEISIVSIYDYIEKHTLPGATQIPAFKVSELTNSYVPDISFHVARLLELAQRRKMKVIAERLLMRAADMNYDPTETMVKAREYLDTQLTQRQDDIVDLKTSLGAVKKKIIDNATGKKNTGTPIGFKWFDRKGGLQEGDLIIIGGDTSMGKTSFALSVALNITLRNNPIAIYSMEMQHIRLTSRLLAMRTGVISSRILYQPLEQEEKSRVEIASNELLGHNCIFYDDKSTNSVDSIIASIRSMHIKHKIKGAIVDYLQLVRMSQFNGSKEEGYAEVARRFKNLAKDLSIWIIALSQLRRKESIKDDPIPTKDRLRGSGQIGEAADVVILLYRPEVYGKNKFPAPFEDEDVHNKAMVIIDKGRDIGLGRFVCNFIPELTFYTEKSIEDVPSIIYHDKDDAPAKADADIFGAGPAKTNDTGDDLPF